MRIGDSKRQRSVVVDLARGATIGNQAMGSGHVALRVAAGLGIVGQDAIAARIRQLASVLRVPVVCHRDAQRADAGDLHLLAPHDARHGHVDQGRAAGVLVVVGDARVADAVDLDGAGSQVARAGDLLGRCRVDVADVELVVAVQLVAVGIQVGVEVHVGACRSCEAGTEHGCGQQGQGNGRTIHGSSPG